MNVLGIETSCDETGVALYSTERGLLADALHSQVDLHAVYGGVVPEIASHDHVRRLLPLIRQVLAKAGVERPDAIAYTAGPGLVGALDEAFDPEILRHDVVVGEEDVVDGYEKVLCI